MIYCVNSFVGWILESDILDGCVGYKYPTYGLLSKEAQAVYDEGLKLWQAFYRADIERKIRDEYLLDKSGAGWYKIRNALKKAAPQTDFSPFETTYAALAAKLEPLVYEYGFLKE
ncbi:hypothetical protein [Neisseria sicca]|nr:hypothetical protein [Neisseria sicca]